MSKFNYFILEDFLEEPEGFLSLLSYSSGYEVDCHWNKNIH